MPSISGSGIDYINVLGQIGSKLLYPWPQEAPIDF